MIDFYYSNH